MNEQLITVVMPVFNGEKYLAPAIDSVLDQSFDNFELIIINDGSTDSTEQIILGYNDIRIRYIRQENTGIGGALRNGCRSAAGKYIARMDADDICLPDRFKIQKEYLDNHSSVVLVSCAVEYINSSGKIIGRSFPYTSDTAIRKKLKTMNPVCHPGVMMRTDSYRNSIGYLNVQPFEDYILWLSILPSGKFYNFRFPLLQYRILPDSISRTISPSQFDFLFKFLHDNMQKGYLNDDEIETYHQIYSKVKQARTIPVNNPLRDGQEVNFYTSAKQLELYRLLKSFRLPESTIEFFICMVKNVFLPGSSTKG